MDNQEKNVETHEYFIEGMSKHYLISVDVGQGRDKAVFSEIPKDGNQKVNVRVIASTKPAITCFRILLNKLKALYTRIRSANT